MEIVQIVPKLPPTVSGVGDYALLLARQLGDANNILTRFVLCDTSCERAPDLDHFTVQSVHKQQRKNLIRQLSTTGCPGTVLLHYVGYGYQKRGVPFWLLHGLKSWKRNNHKGVLIVMFHELYASGPPWSSSFWTSPLQQRLTKSLALLADHCVTNLANSVELLLRMTHCPETKFSLLPVFSNVGEMSRRTNLATRKPRMIVFGSAAWRRQTYIEHRDALERACRVLEISEIVDIGPPCGDIPKSSRPCMVRGSLPAEQVGQEMTDARAGFFTYPAAYLGKSGIFAAYAAYGLVPITYSENIADNKDALRPMEHFLPMSFTYRSDLDQIETISHKAHNWYQAHSIKKQAACYGKLIRVLALQRECRNRLVRAHVS